MLRISMSVAVAKKKMCPFLERTCLVTGCMFWVEQRQSTKPEECDGFCAQVNASIASLPSTTTTATIPSTTPQDTTVSPAPGSRRRRRRQFI